MNLKYKNRIWRGGADFIRLYKCLLSNLECTDIKFCVLVKKSKIPFDLFFIQ